MDSCLTPTYTKALGKIANCKKVHGPVFPVIARSFRHRPLPDPAVEEAATLAGLDLEKHHHNGALRRAVEATRRGRQDDDDEKASAGDMPRAPPDLDRSSSTTRVARTQAQSTLKATTSLTAVKASLMKATTEAITIEVTKPPK